MTAYESKGPLAGLRVLCLAEQYPGPYATLLMSDLGAEVIVVERPGGGDPARSLPIFHESLGRNKSSVALDLKDPDGLDALLRLASASDVFLEGFRPGTADRLGFGWEALHTANPELVYVSISGFGQDGPYRTRPAHDLSFQAMAGLLADIAPDQVGFDGGIALGDLASGMFATIGALAALRQRERSAEGSYVDVSMMDCLISMMTSQVAPVANRASEEWLESEPGYGVYPTADGQITLSISVEEHFWRSLCDVLDMSVAHDMDVPARRANCEELRAAIAQRLAKHPTAHWETILDGARIPFGPVNSLQQVIDDPHVQDRGLLVEVPNAGHNGSTRVHVRQPLKFDGDGLGPSRSAPKLGAQTREVLTTVAGMAPDKVNDLVERAVAAEPVADMTDE